MKMGPMGPRARAPMKLQLAVNRHQRPVLTRLSLVDLIRARAVTPERGQVTTSPAPTGAAAGAVAGMLRKHDPVRAAAAQPVLYGDCGAHQRVDRHHSEEQRLWLDEICSFS
jgi:hypothetical protein